MMHAELILERGIRVGLQAIAILVHQGRKAAGNPGTTRIPPVVELDHRETPPLRRQLERDDRVAPEPLLVEAGRVTRSTERRNARRSHERELRVVRNPPQSRPVPSGAWLARTHRA
jgi:hypothetical protein